QSISERVLIDRISTCEWVPSRPLHARDRNRTVIVSVMTSVLGVSVGASAVRFARRDAETLDGPTLRSRSVTATLERPEEAATESLETVLAETDELDEVQAIGVAYRNETQASAVQTAMARLEIGNFHLVP